MSNTMEVIDIIENKIHLHKSLIDFEQIVDEYLSEHDESENEDKLAFRKSKFAELFCRVSKIYCMDISLTSEDGYSIINIEDANDVNVKRYLHRFLSYKCLIGGTNAKQDGSAELFEEISANAVTNYLGLGAKSIMIGEGRKSLTKEVLEKITDELNEKYGIYCNLPDKAKDDGVDFIVYKPVDDRNIGNIIILGQACVGKHYLEKKPINKRWQGEYIKYAVGPPVTLISVVNYLEENNLRKVHSEFGDSLVFDKGRILKYFDISDDVLNRKIIKFINNIIDDE